MGMLRSRRLCCLVVISAALAAAIGGRESVAQERTVASRLPDDLMAQVGGLAPEFGGVYLDADGVTHLYLTDPSADAAERAQAALAEVFGDVPAAANITIDRANYTFAQLKRWHDQMSSVLTLARVVFTDIDERANRLLVGVADRAAEGAVRNELARLGIPSAAVQIAATPEVTAESLQDSHTPKVGGLQITNGAGTICTLGFNARRAGVAGFVTASHCTAAAGGVENTIFWQPGPPVSCQQICLPLAQETADPPFLDSSSNWLCPNGRICRYSDAAFAKYILDSPLLFTPGRIAAAGPEGMILWNGVSSWSITWEVKPWVNSPVVRVARSSGLSTGNVVKITCANVNVKNTNKTMLCQSKAPYSSAPGDSGAPVLSHTTKVGLLGVQWGSGGWFSPISLIENELGTLSVCSTGYDC